MSRRRCLGKFVTTPYSHETRSLGRITEKNVSMTEINDQMLGFNIKVSDSTIYQNGYGATMGINSAGTFIFKNTSTSYTGGLTATLNEVFTISKTGVTSIDILEAGSLTLFGNLDMAGYNIINGGTITATTLAGTLSTAAQTNITSLGTLTSLTMGGNLNLANYRILNGSTAGLNTAFGTNTLGAINSGFYNTLYGNSCGNAITNGNNNICIGSTVGNTLTTGSACIYLGNTLTNSSLTVDDEIVIGNSLTGKGTRTMYLGNLTPASGFFCNSVKATATNTSSVLRFNTSTYEIAYETNDGWISASFETWAYVSADAPTFVFSVNSDVTTKYSAGMKIRYVQSSTTKYGIITAVGSFSGGVTNITIYGGGGSNDTYTNTTSYTMANSAISSNFYSRERSPYGFPMNQATWSYISTNNQDFSTGSATYVNTGTGTMCYIPIGNWLILFNFVSYANAGADDQESWYALSSSNSSVSHTALSTWVQSQTYNWWFQSVPICLTTVLNLTVKTTFYAIYKAKSSRNAQYKGTVQPTVTRCICTYL